MEVGGGSVASAVAGLAPTNADGGRDANRHTHTHTYTTLFDYCYFWPSTSKCDIFFVVVVGLVDVKNQLIQFLHWMRWDASC